MLPEEVEIEEAVEAGITSITLLGQNVNAYKYDGINFVKLLELVNAVKGLKQIGFITSHPKDTGVELFKAMRDLKRVRKYLHLPVQSGSERILKLMNRGYTRKAYLDLVKSYRKTVKGGVLSTDIIVGFPGEKEEHFAELVDFIKSVRFERLGVFTYSREEGTPADDYEGQLDEKTKLERFNEIMAVQREVAASINESFMGKTIDVLIDEKKDAEGCVYMGRTQGDAPEVDGEVFVTSKSKELEPGDFVSVKITDTLEYDLVGDGSP